MQLEHRFAVALPPTQAWLLLRDPDRVAGCLPGAALESVDGDVFEGRLRVRLGSETFTYRGQGRVVSRDSAQRRVVVELRGRDMRGGSTAVAVVAALVSGNGSASSEVWVTTDLQVTGPPAALESRALEEVSSRLLDQFAERLGDSAVVSHAGAGPAGGERGALQRPLVVGAVALAGLVAGLVLGSRWARRR